VIYEVEDLLRNFVEVVVVLMVDVGYLIYVAEQAEQVYY
jgi:hypothetical protein